MLSLNDIINVSFRKVGAFAGKGYNSDEVDNFIERVRESYEELLKKTVEQGERIEKLEEEKQKNLIELKDLEEKSEGYRTQEDEIKNAIISAQKLGDSSVREARHKAEIIIKDAQLKAEHIVSGCEKKTQDQRKELQRLQSEVSSFRTKLLSMYKEHLALIDVMPSQKSEPQKKSEPVTEVKHETQREPQQKNFVQADEFRPTPKEENKDRSEPLQAEISYFEEEDAAENQTL